MTDSRPKPGDDSRVGGLPLSDFVQQLEDYTPTVSTERVTTEQYSIDWVQLKQCKDLFYSILNASGLNEL